MSLARCMSRASPRTFALIHARLLVVTALLAVTIASVEGVPRETIASVWEETRAPPVVFAVTPTFKGRAGRPGGARKARPR